MSLPAAGLPTPEFVTDTDALARAAAQWRDLGCIGFDSEFERTSTFYQVPALYQVAGGGRCWLIDPIAIDDFVPLADVFEDAGVITLAHACSEDAELLDSHLSVRPVNLIDTQLLLAFCGGRWECGFAEAVTNELGLDLDKGATRSDWLKRPLSQVQLDYAVADAAYLLPLYETLIARLPPERMAWVVEESAARLRAGLPAAPDAYFSGIKGAWRLDLPALQRLQRLAAWRERSARAVNRPRGRVVKDDVLQQLAERPPERTSDLERLLPAGAVRRFGDEILDALEAEPDEDAPRERLPQPLPKSAGNETAALRKALVAQAAELGIAGELLGRRRLIEQLVRAASDGGPLPEAFCGWRRPLLARAAQSAGDIGARIIALLDN